MPKGLRLLSLLLLATPAHASFDNQIIRSEAVSAITLAGRIGEAAMFSVQADDDDDLEIFATASSSIDSENDHWLLLDWDGSDYQIIKTGELQSANYRYLSSLQLSSTKLLLGQKDGKLTTIEFNDDDNSTTHILTETQSLLSELNHEVDDQVDIDTDIKAIVTLVATDQNSYTVLCSAGLTHVLTADTLEYTLDQGSYCQAGNIDYAESSPGVYDQELITQNGQYYTFDGATWLEKNSLSSSNFGDNFLVANIDDDDAQEILSQQSGQLQSFSPASNGSWVYISAIQDAQQNFNAVDIDADGYSEILFDHIITSEEPHSAQITKVAWDTTLDSHVIDAAMVSPYLNASSVKHLPTTLIDGNYGDYFLFTSNTAVANPTASILYRLNANNLSTDWSGIYSTALRSFDGIARVLDGDDISDYNLVQLEQINLGNDNYSFAYKFLNATDLQVNSVVVPDFADDEMIAIDSFHTFDFDQDGTDELHAGGRATYSANIGAILSSNLDGSDHYKLITPGIESVTAFFMGDANLALSTDIVATGKNTTSDGGIGLHLHYDGNSALDVSHWFTPGSGDTDFKQLIASNIKGGDEPEILGLHSQLASFNPNAAFGESAFYNLSNMDLKQFTPITLLNRDYEYALASDAGGMLHLIEPKDFDILASVNACDTELRAISNVRINNNLDVAMAICNQQLLSWAVEYDPNILDYGYSLHALASQDLGNADTHSAQLLSIAATDSTTGGLETHLFALLNNEFHRYLLNKDLGGDGDSDGTANYKDAFLDDETQWADSDQDGLGDNPAPANDPDPSLNDIDNDGVLDDVDPDNIPENDFNPSNDVDNGLPSFTSTPLDLVKAQFTADITSVSITSPTATDVYDEFANNGSPTISASYQGDALTEISSSVFAANLAPGQHTIDWQAQDVQGNASTTSQEVWVYPSIAFEASSQRVGETQTAQVVLLLSGTSPEYPVNVNMSIAGTVTPEDANEDIENLTVSFAEGETRKVFEFSFNDDSLLEGDENLIIEITDDFGSSPDDASWTVEASRNTHTITVADANVAPTFVSSTAQQNGVTTTTPNNIDGSITLSANFTDNNASDSLIYFWDLASLNMPNALLQDVSFNPSELTPGSYILNVTATDNGLPSRSTQQTILFNIYYGDSDNDTFNDDVDAFPHDASEWLDSDGDTVGNNADLFDDNADEWQDSDGDGTGDNADPFDDNASEWKDTDGDGVGDNADLFDDNADEWQDSDGDGVGDNSDDFPTDATKSRKLDDQSLEDNGAGSLHYFLMLLLLPLVLTRTRTK